MKQQNERFQGFINWNRDKLKQELGLTENDIIDLPGLFQRGQGGFQRQK